MPAEHTPAPPPGQAAASVGDLPTRAGDAPPPSTRTLPPADAPPGYALARELGRGGMGVVYLAHQTRLNRPVALKMILSGEHAHAREKARFLAEAEAVAAVKHPNVVQVHELGEHAGRPFLALEYCPGGSLADRLAGGPPLPPAEAAALVAKLADAVQAVHDVGTVHRDLKPANVLLDGDGEPKVTDFGLAKRGGGSEMTRTGAVMGTPAYMAPEQARGDTKLAGPAADVYALGVILFECLTGRRPFAGDDPVALLVAVATADAPPARRLNPGVPADLELVAAKCLGKHPRERYGTAAELADELRRFLRGEPVEVRPLGRRERFGRWVRKNRTLAAAVGAVAAALVLGAGAATAFGLEARKAAKQATAEAERAKQAEAGAAAEAERARAAEARQAQLAAEERKATGRALLARAEAAVVANDPAGSLPYLLMARRADPAVGDLRLGGVLAGLPRVVAFGTHPGAVNHLAVSPDERYLASGANDGSVRLWDLTAGEAGPPLAFPGPVYAVAFSPDGREVAAGGGTFLQSGAVQRYAVPGGKPVGPPATVKGTPMFVGYDAAGRVVSTEFVSANLFLAQMSLADSRPTVVVRTPGGATIDRPIWEGYEPGVVYAAPYTAPAAGRTLAFDQKADRYELLDTATGKPVGGFEFRGRASFAALVADGRYAVLTRWNDRTARVWDVAAGRDIAVKLADGDRPKAAAVADGRLLVVFSDGELHRYTLADGRLEDGGRIDGGEGAVAEGAVFSPDGRLVAALSRAGTVRVVEADYRKPICDPLPHGGGVRTAGVKFLRGGRQLAVAAADGTVRVWDLAPAEKPLFSISVRLSADDLRFLPDGRLCLTGNGMQWREHPDKLAQLGRDAGAVTFGSLDKLDPKSILGTVVGPDPGVCFLRTGGGGGVKVVRWTEQKTYTWHTLGVMKKQVNDLQVSADGRYLLARDADGGNKMAEVLGDLHVWDLTTNTVAFGLYGVNLADQEVSTCGGLHHDPPRVAVGRANLKGSINGFVRLYDLPSGKPVGEPLPVGQQMGPGDTHFSPDGKRLAVCSHIFPTGGGEVRVYDVASGKLVRPPFLTGQDPEKPAFSPDGRRLAVVAGATVYLIDLRSDRPPVELPHPERVGLCRFAAADLLLSGAGNKVRLWDPADGGLKRPPLSVGGSAVAAAAVSADGSLLTAAGNDNQVYGWRLSVGLPADGAERLARLLSARTVDGDLTRPALAAELAADFAHLKRHHPAELTVDARDAVNWHWRQVNAAMAGRAWATGGRQAEAIWPLEPHNDHPRFVAGALALRAGDRAGVRRAADQFAGFVRNNGDKPYPSNLARHAQFGLTLPDLLTGPERQAAVASGRRLAGLVKPDEPWLHLHVALAYLRAGELTAAEWRLARGRADMSDAGRAYADTLLAVVRRLQGRAAEAERLAAAADAARAGWEQAGPFAEWGTMGFLGHLIAEARQPLPPRGTP